ncbi:sulfur carrier protein ThiS [Maridesulfovibrio hydrothermalis]|uniref:Thiamine biosynthesis protein ThiS n=1 Tax=Maridesulfovibrio hydrothermalis AM13 = DSM 14728 TaxID=1121451 RepID=L0RBG9_9BACT|nr:sulfur carrier protein ThiS [Maridesulfovibrio hydrothermalis]CCO24138.1 Thiamine biosynthesis protein ThiS [Maridesulfovibrio hydrothermalis AM13 = DSM 14728]
MIVTLNGKETEIDDGSSIISLLESKQITPDTVVIELNAEIIPADAFGSTIIKDGDHLEVLRFVGGG